MDMNIAIERSKLSIDIIVQTKIQWEDVKNRCRSNHLQQLPTMSLIAIKIRGPNYLQITIRERLITNPVLITIVE